MDRLLLNGLALNSNVIDKEDTLYLLNPALWRGTGLTYNDTRYKSYNSSGYVKSRFTLKPYPEIRMLLKFSPTTTSIWIADSHSSNQNGYKIYFSVANHIKVDRYDNGSATNIIDSDLAAELSSSDYIPICISLRHCYLLIEVDGQQFYADDITYRNANRYLIIAYTSTIYLKVGHSLFYENGELYYGSYMAAAKWWDDTYKMTRETPSLTLAAGWNLELAGLMLPQAGYSISIDLTVSATPQYATFGLKSPDGKYGFKCKFMDVSGSNKVRLYDMQDHVIATSSSSYILQDFIIDLGSTREGYSVTVNNAFSSFVSGTAYLIPNLTFFTTGDDANGLTLNSIILLAEDSIFTKFKDIQEVNSVQTLSSGGGISMPTSNSGGLL